MRLAVGASRGRVLRQLLTESLVLAAIGGGFGALLAVGFVQVLREFASPHAQGIFNLAWGGSIDPAPAQEVGVDSRLLGLAMGLSVITALVAGAMPALQDVADRSGAAHERPRRRRSGRHAPTPASATCSSSRRWSSPRCSWSGRAC